MSSGTHVLVVDDEAFVRDSLVEVLAAEGMSARPASGGREAAAILGAERVDVVVTDLRMPDGDAFLLLEHARAGAIEVPVVVITGVGTVAEAVRAMKAGAYDFLQKPVDPEELVLLVRRAAEHRRLLFEVRSLRDAIEGLRAPRVLVGDSALMAAVRERIARVAPTDSTVLVTGESGTGKDLATEELHRQSARAGRPRVRVPCAALPEDAFARAEGGTLVLDEVGALDAAGQARLLRALEAGADVRVIATANEDLAARARAGGFRADLLHRLDVFPVAMPPLRERRGDIPGIVEHFLAFARRGRPRAEGLRVGPEALEVLSSYAWPGNVRELRNVLERAVIVAGDRELDAPLLRGILESGLATRIQSGAAEFHLRRNLDAAEKAIVQRALSHANGVKKTASFLLGIDPRNMGYYLRKHGLAEAKERDEGG